MDFSKLQIKNLLRRNEITQKMLDVSNNANKSNNNSTPMRIASERNREYVLVKNDNSNGYTMVVNKDSISKIKRNKGLGTVDEPLNLDDSSEEDDDSNKFNGLGDGNEREKDEFDDDIILK